MTGGEVEQTVREVAARLGVADFVYLPTLVSKAQSNREVSDGLLLCRQGGAVIEVKTRDPQAASGDSAEAAARWLRKRYDDAIRQARGTKRTIAQRRQRNDPVRAVAVRALDFTVERRDEFAVPLDADPAKWPIVVVLDHPGAAGVTMPPQENVFAITFDDWCELNRAVRSVNGLVQYVQRVLDAGTARSTCRWDAKWTGSGMSRRRMRHTRRSVPAACRGSPSTSPATASA